MVNGVLKTSFFDFEYRAIRNDKGETVAILHTATDISSRVLAWEKVAEKQQREQQLARVVHAADGILR